MTILTVIGGLMLTIIGYFLKSTMNEIREIKKVSYRNKTSIEVIETNLDNQQENFNKLHNSVIEILKELQELNRIK